MERILFFNELVEQAFERHLACDQAGFCEVVDEAELHGFSALELATAVDRLQAHWDAQQFKKLEEMMGGDPLDIGPL